MDCQNNFKQVMERINDFALGELNPKSELELLAHVAQCATCREAYDHAKTVRSLVDRRVETLVASEPSPQFITRLRARIDAEHAPKRWIWDSWRVWEQATQRRLSYAVGAVALATILGVWIMGLPRRHVSAPSAAEASFTTSASPSVASNSPRTFAIPEQPRKKIASVPAPSPRIRREPEVLVPKGELLAVAQFYDAVHRKPVDSEQLYAAEQETQKPLEVKPIEITPLEPLAKPVADSDNGPGLF